MRAELRGIVEERYAVLGRLWPLLAVIERCASELPEFICAALVEPKP